MYEKIGSSTACVKNNLQLDSFFLDLSPLDHRTRIRIEQTN